MWPPTKKEKAIPIAKPLPDGSLRTIKYWVYDHNSLSAVIRIGKNQISVKSPKDLVMFRERDIKLLSRCQIYVLDHIFEEAAKEYTSMIVYIIQHEFWAGALDGMDVHIVNLPEIAYEKALNQGGDCWALILWFRLSID